MLKENKQLIFSDVKHEYRIDGRILPSVTQVLETAGLVDFSMIPRAVLELAKERGSKVHTMCQYHDEGTLDESTIDIDLKAYYYAYLRFLADYIPDKVILNEYRLYHTKYMFAGTLDRLFEINGDIVLADLKTSEMSSPSTGVQLSAYSEALKDEQKIKVKKRWGVQLHRSRDYTVTEYIDRQDWQTFLSALNIYNWKKSKNLI